VLPGWQLAALRKPLDERGLVTMAERPAFIEQLVGRPVETLRDLTFAEARSASEAMAARKDPSSTAGSTWDNRGEDTWIDRL
jgi:hypothetical protein